MKTTAVISILLFCVYCLPTTVSAATDGMYQLTESFTATWEGTDANRLEPVTPDYDFVYGDDQYLTYNLPWNFTFYQQSYSQISVDTNGNIWFGSTRSARRFNLASSGLGPVSAAWNDDLSSIRDGGVFIQHKTNPERVVIEWQAETFSDEGNGLPNDFSVTLYQNGKIKYGYNYFTAANVRDSGSGISKDDAIHYLSLTSNFGNVPSLAGKSFYFNDITQPLTFTLNVAFTGSGTGAVTSSPEGIACNTGCSAQFPAGTQITLTPQAQQYSLFSGWSAGACSGSGNCVITLNGDSLVSAVFAFDSTHQVKIDGSSPAYYTSIQEAYNAAANGSVIKLWATDYSESLSCGRAVTVLLQGGYDSTYINQIGEVILNGTLTIAEGTLVVDGVSLR